MEKPEKPMNRRPTFSLDDEELLMLQEIVNHLHPRKAHLRRSETVGMLVRLGYELFVNSGKMPASASIPSEGYVGTKKRLMD